MYFDAYPNSEVVTPYPYLYYLNGSFNRPYHYASEANFIQNSASNSTLVPDTPAMRQDIKTTLDDTHFNVQIGNLQQESWSNRGQFETMQGFDKCFDGSSSRINYRISGCHGGPVSIVDKYSETSSQASFNSRNADCRGGIVSLVDSYSKNSSQANINFTNADCHSGPVSIVDKYSETSSQSSFNSRNADCHGGIVSLVSSYSKTNSQSSLNFTNDDCHGGPVSFLDKCSGTTSQAGINSRISDFQDGRVNNFRSSEIWRPFCPSPTREASIDGSDGNQQNFPNRTKIEHSKTSLFKPVKKRDHKCRYCSSSFASSAQLNSHLRVHTGSKPFHCPACRKRFARNEELTRHTRIHSGYKPHACRMCGKSFGRKDHLAKHAKTHLRAEEKRAYACPLPGCGHRYTRSDALTRHRTSAHATYRREGE